MSSRSSTSNRVAIVGAGSLRGRELKQVLEDRHFPASDIVLLDESEMAGTITEAAGEPVVIRALDEDSFENARFVFFAGSELDAEQNLPAAGRAGSTVIDLTGAAARLDRAIPWIPSLSSIFPPRSGTNGSAQASYYSSPAPPVIISCTVAAALAKFSPQRAAILLFPPVSERNQAGVEELESQTTNLLAFRDIAKPVYDAQVAFNLLSGYGEASKLHLDEVRNTISRGVTQYIAGRSPVPAIQLVQAPVFYGYAFSAFAEFSSPAPLEKLTKVFGVLGVKVAETGDPAPTNVSVAGESEIHLAQILPDPGVETGVWLWGVADNLRLAATNAVRIAEELLAKSSA